MARTIKEIAAICCVSEQAVRAWCRKNGIEKQRTDGKKPGYLIADDIERKLIHYFSGDSLNSETGADESNESCETIESQQTNAAKAKNASNESNETELRQDTKATNEFCKTVETNETKVPKPEKATSESIETEKTQERMVFALLEQLAEKDRQLAVKDEQIKSLTDQATMLTNALASAQEAQTRLTESLAAEQALHAGTIQNQLTMQTQADEKPHGFFGRLFGKKKKTSDLSDGTTQ